MNAANQISLPHLCLIGLPLVIVGIIYYRWSLKIKTLSYALARMVIQLIIIGYVLVFIFENAHPVLASAILFIMLLMAAWISLRPVQHLRRRCYWKSLCAISLGGVPVLLLVVLGVLRLEPWYTPRYVIPLAGMIFAYSMNTVSLTAERFIAERTNGHSYNDARNTAYQAGLIPLINSFFAVGLVSIPGMMTGQILSGTSPLLAVRYQIMVMCMLLGSCGIATAIFLVLLKEKEGG